MSDFGINNRNVSSVTSSGLLGSSNNVQLLFAQLQMELAQNNKNEAMQRIDGIRQDQTTSASYTTSINAMRTLKDYDVETYGTIPTDETSLENEIAALQSAIEDVTNSIDAKQKGNVPLDADTMTYLDQHKESGFFEFFRTKDKVTDPSDTDSYSKRDNLHSQDELQKGLAALTTRLNALEAMHTVVTAQTADKTSILSQANINISSSFDSNTVSEWISNLEAIQEEVGSNIQQEMVLIQDAMGQYNSYTQGASSAISQASETLKTVARG